MRMIVEMKSFHLDCQYFAKVGEQLSKIIFGNDDSLYLHWKEKQDNFDSWIKNDGEKWSRKKYFKIPRWPSELLLPSAKKSAQKVSIFHICNTIYFGCMVKA